MTEFLPKNTRLACRLIGAAVALGVLSGSAFASVTSNSPMPNRFGDLNDEFFGGPGIDDLPIVDDGNPPPNEIPPDIRAHSDVPDLPDSGGPDTDETSLLLGSAPNWPHTWYVEPAPVGSDFDLPFGEVDGVAPVASASPVPAPGTIGALGVLAAAAGIRRRRSR